MFSLLPPTAADALVNGVGVYKRLPIRHSLLSHRSVRRRPAYQRHGVPQLRAAGCKTLSSRFGDEHPSSTAASDSFSAQGPSAEYVVIRGRPSFGDERCSAKMASMFVSNPFSDVSVATTFVDGECQIDFEGTSAATAVASGAVALALEANPELTWRDVQYLIVYTSNSDILTGDDLATNGAGLNFSHHFGFGAIDAEALVTRARHWINVPQQLKASIPFSENTTVSPSSNEVISVPYTGDVGSLEHVVVQLSTLFVDTWEGHYESAYEDLSYDYYNEWAHHVTPNRGDIQIELRSPRGTTSILLPYRTRDSWPGKYNNWPFMSVHFWGEDPSGEWTLTITNTNYQDISSVQISDVQFIFYGTGEKCGKFRARDKVPSYLWFRHHTGHI